MSALRTIREARGLSQKQLAQRMHTTDVSISRYEKEEQRLTLPLLRKFAEELDCKIAEIAEEEPVRSEDGQPAGDIVPEIDVRGGMGGGGLQPRHNNRVKGGQTISADKTVGEWVLPPGYLSRELRAQPDSVGIFEVQGDSMAPTLQPGDRVMVDTNQKTPSPPGIFALWDGLGVVVKRIEFLSGSEPPTIEVISDNTLHERRSRTLEEAHIIGRVVWFARRL